jgi:hypothetical protein
MLKRKRKLQKIALILKAKGFQGSIFKTIQKINQKKA